MEHPQIHDIPKDVLALAFGMCDDHDLTRIELVCKRWQEAIKENPALLARVRNLRERGRWRWFCLQSDFKETRLQLKGHRVLASRPLQLDGHSYILALGVRKRRRKSTVALLLLSAKNGKGNATATKWAPPTSAAFTGAHNSQVICSQLGAGGHHLLSRITFTSARRGWALKIEPIPGRQTAYSYQTKVEWTTEGRFLTCNSKEKCLEHQLQLWGRGGQLRSIQIADAQVSLCAAGAAAVTRAGTFRLYGPEHIGAATPPPMRKLRRFVPDRHTLKQVQATESSIVCLLATPDVSDRLVSYNRNGTVECVIKPKVLPLDSGVPGQPDLSQIHGFGALSLAGELIVTLRAPDTKRDDFGTRLEEAALIFPKERARARHVGSFAGGGNQLAFVTGEEFGLLTTDSTQKHMYLLGPERSRK